MPQTPGTTTVISQAPWIIATGFSRGIGAALGQELKNQINILTLGRTSALPKSSAFHIDWDLAKPLDRNPHEALEEFLKTHRCLGFIHCAGVLGPLGSAPSSSDGNAHYWQAFDEAMAINFRHGAELAEKCVPFLLPLAESHPWQPFVMHLSSGAAVNPYEGWNAYCASKAAALMHYRCLAKRLRAEDDVVCLSLAPGRVMTDMMKDVLQAPAELFPDGEAFRLAAKKGEIQSPEKVALQLASLLLGDPKKLRELHGHLYDLRKGIVV